MSDLAVEFFNRLQLIDTRGDMRTLIPILLFQWKCSFCMRSKVGKTPYLANRDISFPYIFSSCQWLSPRAGSRGYIALLSILQLLVWIRYKLCNRYKVLGDTHFMGFRTLPFTYGPLLHVTFVHVSTASHYRLWACQGNFASKAV